MSRVWSITSRKFFPVRMLAALSIAGPLSLTPLWSDDSARAVAPESVAFSQAGVSAAPTQWVDRIVFEDFNDSGDTTNQLRSANGITSALGTIQGSSSGTDIFTDQQWGGAPCTDCTGTRSSKFASVGNGSITVTLSSSTTYRYVGFWWSAGSPNNYICLLPETGSTCVAEYNTGDLEAHPSFTRSGVTGPTWQSRPHYGNPRGRVYTGTTACNSVNGGTGHCGEPFAFIHIFQDSGFRRIRFSGDQNTGFEFDNITASTSQSWELIDLLPNGTLIGAGTLPAYSLTAARVLPVDPRDQSVAFPGVILGGAASQQANASLCVTETDSAGTPVAAGNSNLRITATVPSSVTAQSTSPRFAYSGSQTTIRDLAASIQINSSTTDRTVLTNTASRYIRVSVQARIGTGLTTCSGTSNIITAVVVELRPMRLNKTDSMGIPLD